MSKQYENYENDINFRFDSDKSQVCTAHVYERRFMYFFHWSDQMYITMVIKKFIIHQFVGIIGMSFNPRNMYEKTGHLFMYSLCLLLAPWGIKLIFVSLFFSI